MSQNPITPDDRPTDWIAVAQSHDLPAGRPVIPVKAFGQRLVLFRDNAGDLGLMGRHCPHRGADLCFGRREDNGLRCPFHGWHFDRTGQCTEQPAEPVGSTMYKAIRLPAFPVIEAEGVIYGWFGDGPPPALSADPGLRAERMTP